MTPSEDTPDIPPLWLVQFPRLDDVVKLDDVAKKGGGNFQAEYVNWAKVSHYMREHAPGWQPFMERDSEGRTYHQAPNGSVFLLIGFRHPAPDIPDTETVVHAIMDQRNNAKAYDQVDARDISDGYVRGMCKAAALLFGLAWKLWSKDDPMTREDGQSAPPAHTPKAKAANTTPQGNIVHCGKGEPPEAATAKDADIFIDYAEVPARVFRCHASEGWDQLMPGDAPYTVAHKTVAKMLAAKSTEEEIPTQELFKMLADADSADHPAERFSEVSLGALARTLEEIEACPL